MIVEQITRYLSEQSLTVNDHLRYQVEKLAGYAFQRQFMEDAERKPGVLRLSDAGKCPRQTAYRFHGYEPKGKLIDSRAKIVFFQGDLAELMMVNLARLAGVPVMGTGLNQVTVRVTLSVNPLRTVEVEGHPDGFFIHQGVKLLECKSMSSFAFERFERGDIDPAYRAQIMTYLKATGLTTCVLLAMNKDSGVLGELVLTYDAPLVQAVEQVFREVVSSTKDRLPDAPAAFAPDAKGYYPWNCLYCSYWAHCRVGAQRVLVGKSYKLMQEVADGVPAEAASR